MSWPPTRSASRRRGHPTSKGWPGGRAFYDRQRDRGATHYQALRALANRLVGILHSCLRHQTPHDEHLAWHTEPDNLSTAA